MPGKPTLCPIVEIKIPQNPSYDGHIRRQTPEFGSRAQKVICRTPYGSRAKTPAILIGSNLCLKPNVPRQLAIQTIRQIEPPPTNLPRNLHVGVILSCAFSGPPISTQLLPASCSRSIGRVRVSVLL
jgi:hypothetical protein